MVSDGCFDNGLRRAEVATGYEHWAGHTTYLAGLSSEWTRSLVPKVKVSDYSSRSTLPKVSLINVVSLFV